MWTFGIIAINTCRFVIFRYPKVCQMITKFETFNCFPQQIRELILSGAEGFLPSFNEFSMTPFAPKKFKNLPQLEENCLNIKLLPSNDSTVC